MCPVDADRDAGEVLVGVIVLLLRGPLPLLMQPHHEVELCQGIVLNQVVTCEVTFALELFVDFRITGNFFDTFRLRTLSIF